MPKKYYSDDNGETTTHRNKPFSFNLDEGYDYRRCGLLPTVGYYLLHLLGIILFYPVFYLLFGFRISGRENARAVHGKGVVTICNHVHALDCVMISMGIGLRRTHYISLASNFCIPVVGHLVRLMGGVPISGAPHQLMRVHDEMIVAIKSRAAVQVYPEGILVPYCDQLRTFKRGAFLLATHADTPVLPMVLIFNQPKGLRSLIRKKPLPMLCIAPPVYPDESLPERQRIQHLQKCCRQEMLDAMLTKQL